MITYFYVFRQLLKVNCLNKYETMTKAPLEKLIIKLSVPTIISMLVTTFYNMADTYFVSRMHSTSATGAVGVVFSLMAVIQAFGFFFGHGSGNFISRALGAGKREEAEKMASTGFFLAAFAGLCIAVIGLIFIKPLAYILGATRTIYPYARDYLAIILVGAPFMCSSLVLNNQLRFQGNASFAMVGITSGALLNCGLDPLLISVLGMGIRGAALATLIGQIVSFIVLFAGVYRSDSINISPKKFTFNGYYVKNIINGGLPSLCRQSISSLATICMNLSAGSYGDYAITAMSVCARTVMFFNSAMIGFGQGFQPVCGFNYGAKKYDRVIKAFWFCVKVSFVFLFALSVLSFAFAPNIITIFSDDPKVIAFGTPALRFMSASFPLSAFIVMSNMCMQTIGKSVRASFLALARQGLFLIPLLLVLSYFFGAVGIQMAQMWADIITFIISVPLQISVINEMKREII